MPTISELRRNIVVNVNRMDETATALYKATTNDKLPPKMKHVRTLVRLMDDAEASVQVDLELAKRLHACRSPRMAAVAAKSLVVMHHIAIAGHAATLTDSVRELAAVCSGRWAAGPSPSSLAEIAQGACGRRVVERVL